MTRHAIVVGAGLAGSSAAERLAARGWSITLLDAAAAPGQGASGNRAGVLRPLPSLDDNRLARLTRAAFTHARAHFHALLADELPLRWRQTGVLHLARDEKQAATQRRVVEERRPPAEDLRFVERAEASRLAGWPVANGGWWFPNGGWVDPASLCRANLARHATAITAHFHCRVARIERPAECWRVFDENDRCLAAAPVLVLANASDARRFAATAHLPLRPARGQVSHLPATDGTAPEIVVCRGGYVTPAIDGIRCAGATFGIDDTDTVLRTADHAENLVRLDAILPGYGAAWRAETLDGRVGCRPMSPDRLPMIGAVADPTAPIPRQPVCPLAQLPRQPGLYVIDGFGARGIVWSALAGELLACLIDGDAPPLPADLIDAVDPGRFLLRGRAGTARRQPSPPGDD
jgi:tRNA 5-methylaminomethyl-2-thiouridine biosynthesis bifunctional protein